MIRLLIILGTAFELAFILTLLAGAVLSAFGSNLRAPSRPSVKLLRFCSRVHSLIGGRS